VTQHTKRFIRCFWVLNRDLANARHYPAVSWNDSYSEYAAEVESWWEKVNPEWKEVRSSAMDLLKKEQRLAEIVRLIGPDALPDNQRLVLIAAEIIRNGFLQQNSFDEVDMYCIPSKQIRLLELIMEFYEKADTCIKLGAPLIKITSLPIREGLSRLKSDVKNEEISTMFSGGKLHSVGKLAEFEREMRSHLDVLERSYRNREVL
jgi:V/A-type H+-transporting ATPase subunit A